MISGGNMSRIALFALGWCAASLQAAQAPVETAADPESEGVVMLAPQRLDPAVLGGSGLHDVPPVPQEYLLSGVSKPSSAILYEGEHLKVEVYEEQQVKLPLSPQGMPYDEFVHVLEGTLILSDQDGNVSEYHAGDFVVIPKGFRGTWETRGKFRELIVVERTAWEATHGSRAGSE